LFEKTYASGLSRTHYIRRATLFRETATHGPDRTPPCPPPPPQDPRNLDSRLSEKTIRIRPLPDSYRENHPPPGETDPWPRHNSPPSCGTSASSSARTRTPP